MKEIFFRAKRALQEIQLFFGEYLQWIKDCKMIEEWAKEAEKKIERATSTFPACARKCSIIEILGAGECESVCPKKFTRLGSIHDKKEDSK